MRGEQSILHCGTCTFRSVLCICQLCICSSQCFWHSESMSPSCASSAINTVVVIVTTCTFRSVYGCYVCIWLRRLLALRIHVTLLRKQRELRRNQYHGRSRGLGRLRLPAKASFTVSHSNAPFVVHAVMVTAYVNSRLTV